MCIRDSAAPVQQAAAAPAPQVEEGIPGDVIAAIMAAIHAMGNGKYTLKACLLYTSGAQTPAEGNGHREGTRCPHRKRLKNVRKLSCKGELFCCSGCRVGRVLGAFSANSDGLRHPAAASHSLASRWPRPQRQLPVSAIGGGRCSCRTHGSAPVLTHGAPLPGHSLEKLPAHSPWFQGTLSGATVGALSEQV